MQLQHAPQTHCPGYEFSAYCLPVMISQPSEKGQNRKWAYKEKLKMLAVKEQPVLAQQLCSSPLIIEQNSWGSIAFVEGI